MRFNFLALVHDFHLKTLESLAGLPQFVREHALPSALEEFILEVGQLVRETVVDHGLVAVQHQNHQFFYPVQENPAQLLSDQFPFASD